MNCNYGRHVEIRLSLGYKVKTLKLATFRNIPSTYLTTCRERQKKSFGRVFETDPKTLGEKIGKL